MPATGMWLGNLRKSTAKTPEVRSPRFGFHPVFSGTAWIAMTTRPPLGPSRKRSDRRPSGGGAMRMKDKRGLLRMRCPQPKSEDAAVARLGPGRSPQGNGSIFRWIPAMSEIPCPDALPGAASRVYPRGGLTMASPVRTSLPSWLVQMVLRRTRFFSAIISTTSAVAVMVSPMATGARKVMLWEI